VEYVAFLSFNETGVPTFTIPYYQAGQEVAPTHPREPGHPKAWETNPTANVHLLHLGNTNLAITEVAWVTDDHASLLLRTINRVQELEKVVLVDVSAGGTTKVVRESGALLQLCDCIRPR